MLAYLLTSACRSVPRAAGSRSATRASDSARSKCRSVTSTPGNRGRTLGHLIIKFAASRRPARLSLLPCPRPPKTAVLMPNTQHAAESTRRGIGAADILESPQRSSRRDTNRSNTVRSCSQHEDMHQQSMRHARLIIARPRCWRLDAAEVLLFAHFAASAYRISCLQCTILALDAFSRKAHE